VTAHEGKISAGCVAILLKINWQQLVHLCRGRNLKSFLERKCGKEVHAQIPRLFSYTIVVAFEIGKVRD